MNKILITLAVIVFIGFSTVVSAQVIDSQVDDPVVVEPDTVEIVDGASYSISIDKPIVIFSGTLEQFEAKKDELRRHIRFFQDQLDLLENENPVKNN